MHKAGDSYIVSLDSETLKMSAAFSQLSIRDTKPNLVKVSTPPPLARIAYSEDVPSSMPLQPPAISPGIYYKGRDVGIRYKEPIARPNSA